MNASPVADIREIGPDTFRISVPMPPEFIPGGFSFNQYLVIDEAPLLFHTGPRRLFPQVSAQIAKVMPLSRLRYVAFSHFEADECGALPDFLRAAPQARPVCSDIGAMVSTRDFVDVEPLGMADGQVLSTGRHELVWQATPHLPHGWDCGYLFDRSHGTLFCGDLYTQPGTGERALTTEDILAPSEGFRQQMDYYAHGTQTRALLDKLAALRPERLACMHGSAWIGDGAALLRRLADRLGARAASA